MQEPERNPSCKVVILGNSGVGKTSLINRWTTGVWNSSVKPTIGANHQRKTVDLEENSVDVFIWDTAGQEQFQSLTPLYARSAACAIITASITDTLSFDAIPTWIDLLKNACEKMPPLILLVNKIDVQAPNAPSHDDIEKKYSEMFVAVFFVSAQSGENVDGAFSLAAQCGYDFMTSNKQIQTTSIAATQNDKKNGCC